jgi:four helix bundle protein
MRDYKKLEVFFLADQLALLIYRITADFPRTERYPLADQLRRAALSVPSNIVEGCSRHTEPDFLHFLDVAYASAREAAINSQWCGGWLSSIHQLWTKR